MTAPEVNLWAVLFATASTMVVGSLFYSPKVLGSRWMALAHVDRDRVASRGVIPIVVTVLVSFVTAWVLAGATWIAHSFYDGGFLRDALLTGVFLWAGFTAARVITHDAFEARPAALTALTISHELVTVLVMALVIGLVGV